ncbi:hypothetical protein BH10ACI3_BH10ACI3_25580 [soil metagenome]
MAHNLQIDEEIISDEFRWNLLQRKAMELRAAKAFALFRAADIEPILIKGWAAGLCYPESRIRTSIDTDLAVSAADYNKANAIAVSDAASGLAIDLHRELRHLDSVEWDDLFENSRLIETDGGTIRVLRPEDHLRVLCVHWLTDGGSSKDRLWDIYYAIDNRPADFEWSRFLDTVSTRRRRWLACTVGLAHRYLGLDLSQTPLFDAADDLPDWLITTVEREWSSKMKTSPLETTVHDGKLLFEQIKRRLNPNPIWATIQMEGSFDAKTRIFYKIGNSISRIVPSYRRISGIMKARQK